MNKTLHIPIAPEVRNYIFQRDKYQCQSCGKTYQEANLSIDYIIPLSRGGKNDITNLQTLCLTCNQRKTDKINHRFHRHFDILTLFSFSLYILCVSVVRLKNLYP
jgi:5-methylcytosine-specific restriction endonuclease McrA